MKMKNAYKSLAAAVALLSFSAGSAFAVNSAALVTSISGATNGPTIYSEIQPGTVIKLGASGAMKFVHYQKCSEVEVRGGTLTVNGGNFKLTNGKIVSESAQPCPQQVRMAQSTAVAGGLVMRGVGKTTEISDKPSLVIVGENATKITKVGVYDNATLVTELPVTSNQVQWKDATGLKPGADYRLSLMGADNKQIMEMAVRVVDANKVGVVIVRVE